MKWFKHLIEKFSSKDEEEHFWEEEDLETEQIEPKAEKKKSFRFPIIDDSEIKGVSSKIDSSFNLQKKIKKESVQSEVYDVEEPKIRELLEQRRKRIKHSYTASNYKPKSLKYYEVNIHPHQPIQQKKLEKVEKEPTIIRKRFVPTEVPSPVYGFQKKKTLEKDKKDPVPKTEVASSAQEAAASVEFLATQSNGNDERNSFTNQNGLEIVQNHDETTEKPVQTPHHAEREQKLQIEKSEKLASFIETQNEEKHDVETDNEEVTKKEVFRKLELEIEEPEQNVVHAEQQEGLDFQLESYVKKVMDDEQIEEGFSEEKHEEEVKQYNLNTEDVKPENRASVTVETETKEHNILQQKEDELPVKKDVDPIPESDQNEWDESKGSETIQPSNSKKEPFPKKLTGSPLPFNVLMLKSDKEKLARKLSQKNANVQTPANEQKKDPNENNETKEQGNVYKKPPIDFLTPPEDEIIDQEWMETQADKLVEALSYFQISAQIESIMQGPAVTQFEITVAHGIKVSKIRNLADDLKLALAAKDIRIQAPIPGKSTIGIEIPNRISRAVRLSEVVTSESFLQSDSPLEAALGLDLTGKPVTIDLRKMPHGLIAGVTGSGKSVCINSILVSLLYKADPSELKLMLIDPKMVELAPFNNIPHLVSPVITDVKAATAALKWAVEEMERRYQLFAESGVRDLPRYNKFALQNNKPTMPYILIVIDELADLMMMSPADVEEAICRIAQKARACGIHLIVATQRPSVDVITGLIKSNIPTRIAFSVSSQVDSRTILDQQGAERLLGRGDMLYLGNGMSAPIRIQGTFVTDDEIEMIVDFIKKQDEPNYFFQQDELLKKTETMEEQDELFEEVCRFVAEQGTASTSLIQRKYHIGYNRAARLIDMMEQQGFISEQRGSKPREVYITVSDVASMFKE